MSRAPRLAATCLVLPALWLLRCSYYVGLPAEPDEGGVSSGGEGGPGTPPDGGVIGEIGVAACDPAEAPPPGAVFVALPTNLDAVDGDGSAAAPFTTLGAAVAAVTARGGGAIVIAAGTYRETLALGRVSFSMQGAWIPSGATWRRDCAAGYVDRTQIVSRGNTGLTVREADGLTLRNLTVRSEADSKTDANRYGIFALNTNLVLDNVRVVAPPAVSGGSGAAGIPGAPPSCTLATTCAPAPAPGFTPAAAAPAGGRGTFDVTGYLPADGTPGIESGGPGSAGMSGPAGEVGPFCSTGATCTSSGCDPQSGELVGGNGRCGCGGNGGGPGASGQGGGASVGVLVVGKGVQLITSLVAAGAGGNGGAGAQGGPGSDGTPGAKGASVDCYPVQCCGCSSTGQCYGSADWNACCSGPQPTPTALEGGSPGGAGSPGGSGQAGGGGAGGPSIAVVLLGQARKIEDRSQYSFGQGGVGAGGAPSGEARAELVVP